MGVGQQNKIQPGGIHRQLLIFKNVLALLHTAVHKAHFIACLNKRAASRDLVGRA